MKKFTIVLSIIILSINIIAQNPRRKGFIGISLGPSMPFGDFADNSVNNENTGFAKNGILFSPINFGYIFGQHFGVSASWFGLEYPIDKRGQEATWSYGGLMAGPLYSVPINEKFDFDLKGMIGFVSATSDLDDYEEDEGTGASFNLGASLRYNFALKWCFLVNGDYFTSNPELEKGNQKMDSFNLSFGVAYRLK